MSMQYPLTQDPLQTIRNYNAEAELPHHLIPAGAKTTLAVFTFPLDDLSDIGRCVLEYAKDHPWLFGISAAIIVGGVLFLTVPVLVGFGEYGPVEGSIAAAWQSWLGNVVKGSLFAWLQRLSMTGVFHTIGAALVAMGIAMPIVPIINACKNPGQIHIGLPDAPRWPGSAAHYVRVGGVMWAVPAAAWAVYFGFPGV